MINSNKRVKEIDTSKLLEIMFVEKSKTNCSIIKGIINARKKKIEKKPIILTKDIDSLSFNWFNPSFNVLKSEGLTIIQTIKSNPVNKNGIIWPISVEVNIKEDIALKVVKPTFNTKFSIKGSNMDLVVAKALNEI